MPNLQDLQERLRNDADLRTRFVQDPAAVLSAEDIQLSPEMLQFLQQQIQARNLNTGVMPPDANAISVSVTVGN